MVAGFPPGLRAFCTEVIWSCLQMHTPYWDANCGLAESQLRDWGTAGLGPEMYIFNKSFG